MKGYKISVNPDKEHADKIREGIKECGGYCPCAIYKTSDTRCMCQEFRDHLSDPEWFGYCHCELYEKVPC